MLIAIDASRANKTEKTGTEWYSYHLIQELKKLSPSPYEGEGRVRFILYSPSPLQGDLALLPPHWESRVLRWPLKRFWTQGRLSLEMLFCKPDVLFVPSHAIPFVHPRRTITTIHDIGFKDHRGFYARQEAWYHRWALRLALSKADRIIVPSEFTKKELGNDSRIVVIPHGVDPRFHHKYNSDEIQTILTKYHIQQPYFFYIGRLEDKKNTPTLLRAFSLFISSNVKIPISNQSPNLNDQTMTNYQLVLAGKEGYGFSLQKYSSLIKGLVTNLRILGYVPDADVPLLMAGVHAFVFPSLYEGFGIPLLEAMASGVPIIASRCASIPEVVGDAALLVDQPHKPEAWVAAFKRMTHEEALRRMLTQQGLERVKSFSWEQCAKKTWNVLISSMNTNS